MHVKPFGREKTLVFLAGAQLFYKIFPRFYSESMDGVLGPLKVANITIGFIHPKYVIVLLK